MVIHTYLHNNLTQNNKIAFLTHTKPSRQLIIIEYLHSINKNISFVVDRYYLLYSISPRAVTLPYLPYLALCTKIPIRTFNNKILNSEYPL